MGSIECTLYTSCSFLRLCSDIIIIHIAARIIRMHFDERRRYPTTLRGAAMLSHGYLL